MKKNIAAIAVMLMSGSVLAEITCYAERGNEALEVRIIDTFLDRMAFIKRTHPTIKFPKDEINVAVIDKTNHISIVSESLDFNLVINHSGTERRFPPVYEGFLSYGEIYTPVDCILE